MTLGNRIQEIRSARDMSQEQFGEMLGTTRQTVSKWELDQVIPDIRKIVAISKLFCVPTEELLLNVTTFENEGVRFGCGVYIVLDGCGGEEYIFRKNEGKLERFA